MKFYHQLVLTLLLGGFGNAFGQISVSSPASGLTVNECSSYILRFSPGVGYSGNAIAEIYQNNSSGPIVQTIGYPSTYFSVNYDNVISASGLSPGNYQIKVRDAFNSSNYGWSGIFTINQLPPPSSIQLSTANYTWFSLHWPTVPGATSYRVDVSTTSNFQNTVPGYSDRYVSPTESSGFYVTGLNSGTTYYVRIRSVNACRTSTNSTIFTTSTLACTPLTTPTANAATSVNATKFTANWVAVSGATQGYDIIVTRSGHAPEVYTAAAGTTSKVIEPLHPASSYTYTVKAKGCSISNQSNSVSVATTALGIPTITKMSASGSNYEIFEWTVQWKSVEGATEYQFQVSPFSNFSVIFYSAMSSDVIESFEANECDNYHIRVRAKCATGEFSEWDTDFAQGFPWCKSSDPMTRTGGARDSIARIAYFPNPVTDFLQVTFPSSVEIDKTVIELTDIEGVRLNTIRTNSQERLELDVRHITSGVYLLNVFDGRNKYFFRFIKQ